MTIELTKAEAHALAEHIDSTLIDMIRNDTEIDSLYWVICMIHAYEKLCVASGYRGLTEPETEESEEEPPDENKEKKPMLKDEILRLHAEGMRNPDIARTVGCAASHVYNTIKRAGLTPNGTPIDTGRIKALYDAGRSISWIADDMGIEARIIGAALKELKEKGEVA